MADVFVPLLIGLLVAVPIVIAIRVWRYRAARRRPPIPEVPVSRQHKRAIERRANKRR